MTNTEASKFEASVKKIQKQVRRFAASAVSEMGPENAALIRALDRLSSRVRFVASEVIGADWTQSGYETLADEYYSRVAGLIAARKFAAREAGANLKAERDAEIARLDAEIRAKRKIPEGAYRLGWL